MAVREKQKYRFVYDNGSAAPRLEPVPDFERELRIRQERLRRQREIEERKSRERRLVRRNLRRESAMSLGYVAFLAAAIVVVGIFCGVILHQQSQLTAHREKSYALQKQLDDLQRSNDILEHEILTSANLNEIKKAAKELGMTYPDGDQVYYYSVESDAYQVENGIFAK